MQYDENSIVKDARKSKAWTSHIQLIRLLDRLAELSGWGGSRLSAAEARSQPSSHVFSSVKRTG
jgi:hypothetical protein